MKMPDFSSDVPWKQRFRVPVVIATQVARKSPERGLAVSNQSGIYQLHAWNVTTGELKQITDKPAGVVFGGISPDGEYIYYHDDEQGNEIGHFVRVPFAGGEPEDITPHMPPYASFSIGMSLNSRVLGFLAAGADGFRMYTMPQAQDYSLGDTMLVYHSERLSFGPMLAHDGDYAVITTTERSQTTDKCVIAFRMEVNGWQQIGLLEEADSDISPVGFSPVANDTRLLATSNASGYSRPLIWDVRSGDRIDLPLPQLEGDVSAWGWSEDGQRILLSYFHQAQYQLYVYDLEQSILHRLDHPGGTYGSGYFMGGEIFVNWQDATTPSQVIALDAATGERKRVVLAAGETPESRPWRSVNFKSTGDADIQAWLAVPAGDGPFPTILHTHGGPTSVQTETFSAAAQAWLDHGFAWMSVNYRGSVTFGREFEHAIIGMLGHREIDDMAAAYQWLVDNGVAQPDAVLLTGGSYGGYLTLQGLGKKPELWAGGMAQVAIADWKLMYEDQAETLRGYQRSLFGGTPDELPEQHATSSPITYADAINAPVLVIQGQNDTRCPSRQMQVYEGRLKDAGKDITIHWFDAGHGSRAMEQSIEHQELMLRWAYRILV
jgi:dipeptidyl aminopeptidase/acylaminoacyl peptidase